MWLLFLSLQTVSLFSGPVCDAAASLFFDEPAGVALLNGSGLRINGAYLGDADYDVSKTRGGCISVSRDGRSLTGRVLRQSSGLDNMGSSFSALSLLGELSFDSLVHDIHLRPYVSSGASYAKIDVEALGEDGIDEVLLMQIGAGAAIELSPVVTFDLRYRYFFPMNRDMHVGERPIDIDIGTHNVLLGLRLKL